MKIVFCGPPHSGKSVFIANLINKLPTDAYTIIKACPDGEGIWSNNKNQNETNIVRKKGKFTKSFIENSCKAIDNQTNKIVLVDVGGAISKENEQIFKHCDSFIVLSSDEKEKNEWVNFGQSLGLECIGELDSSLEGQEKIYSREPYLQGKIVGLERGKLLKESAVIKGIASDIIKKSKYTEKENNNDKDFFGIMIDDTELGFELGYGKEIYTEDGTLIRNVKWPESSLPKIHDAIEEKADSNKPLRLNGIRANFVLSTICKTAKEKGVKDISCYDIRTKQYIPIKDFSQERGIKQSEGLLYNLIENKNNVFLDIDITKEHYSLEDYQKCILPKIKENKNLYLSGRIPLWLLASISNSYDSNKIYTFQPGKGFTCVASKDTKELGKIVDGVDGININQYFDDKKEKNKEELLTIVKKQNLFSKIIGAFSTIKEKQKNKKYLDNKIIANEILPEPQKKFDNSKFNQELKNETIKEQSKIQIKADLENKKENTNTLEDK